MTGGEHTLTAQRTDGIRCHRPVTQPDHQHGRLRTQPRHKLPQLGGHRAAGMRKGLLFPPHQLIQTERQIRPAVRLTHPDARHPLAGVLPVLQVV